MMNQASTTRRFITSRPEFPSLLAALALVISPAVHGTSVTLQGGFGYPAAKDSSGAPLAVGHKVSIGTFADGFDPVAHAGDLPALLAHWHQFAFTTTDKIDGDAGSFWLNHSSPDGKNLEGFSFPGKKIYLLLTRTAAVGSEPAADGSNVLDYAVFTGSSPVWVFPAPPSDGNLPPGDLRNLNTSQITTALAGTADPSTGLFALTSYSSDPSDPSTGSAFDQWLSATFGQNSTITADSVVGPSGLSALATFALNSTPDSTAPPYTTVSDETTGRIGIEFTRKKPAVSGFATHAQACTTLSSWALDVDELVIAETETIETVRAFPVFPEGTDTSKAFFRIRVEPAGN
jgi:hypothetical protein